jgi:oligo-1,6-glucosidase
VNNNYKTINEAAQDKDPNSVLNYFRKIVKLRKDNLALVYGKYTLLDKTNPDVYAYTREMDGKKLLILLNFRSIPQAANTGIDISKAKILIDNYPEPSTNGQLKPYEAVVYEL